MSSLISLLVAKALLFRKVMFLWVDEPWFLYMNFHKLNVFTSEEAC